MDEKTYEKLSKTLEDLTFEVKHLRGVVYLLLNIMTDAEIEFEGEEEGKYGNMLTSLFYEDN